MAGVPSEEGWIEVIDLQTARLRNDCATFLDDAINSGPLNLNLLLAWQSVDCFFRSAFMSVFEVVVIEP